MDVDDVRVTHEGVVEERHFGLILGEVDHLSVGWIGVVDGPDGDDLTHVWSTRRECVEEIIEMSEFLWEEVDVM